MSGFPIPLFPEGSLASSVVTTVWVGVVVFAIMNLRFGWVFSGLVVPGYLVPLLIVKPWAAVIIAGEAVLTYGTVYGMSRLLPGLGVSCSFFGRDRFVFMLMVSAFYRVIGDAWLLPLAGEWIATRFGIVFDYRNNLHSFGLVVICLAANQLWKTGVIRGAFPFIFNILLTYVVVRFGLMELTNFNITNLSYLYEDIATSVYAAPKAYIILITTAIIASRINLLYGWDFNGILIPALIALQWYEPVKVLTSFVEALVILFVAVAVMRLPVFRSVTIEGSRKVLLFFTISFLYKMAIGWGLFFFEPSVKVSDHYGFGYLLTSLIAIKMHEMDRIWHQVRITTQVSLFSVLLANVIGFGLTAVRLPISPELTSENGELPGVKHFRASEFRDRAFRAFILAHRSVLHPDGTRPMPGETELWSFQQGMEYLCARLRGKNVRTRDIRRAGRMLAAAGFRLERYGRGVLGILPREPGTGRPALFVNLRTGSELAVECPDALRERFLFDAALTLFRDQSARFLVIEEESAEDVAGGGPGRVWRTRLHRLYGRRGGAVEICRSTGDGDSLLHVRRSLPVDLEIRKLEARFGEVELLWADSGRESALKRSFRSRTCELHLGGVFAGPGRKAEVVDLRVPLDSFVRERCRFFAPKASGLYVPPLAEELLHFDRHIIEPLFALAEENLVVELDAIDSAAAGFGYRATLLERGGERFVLLHEPVPRRFWGSVLVRVTEPPERGRGLCFEVSGRVADESVLSFAATQFRRFGGRALIMAGTHPLTNPDGSSKLTEAWNRESLFNLAHQAFCRSESAPRVIQCRAFLPAPGQPYPDGDLIVAPYFGNRPEEAIIEALAPLERRLKEDGIRVTGVGHCDSTSPYVAGFNSQGRFIDFTRDGTFAIFWLSPFLRDNFQVLDEGDPLLKMVKSAGIPIHRGPLEDWLEGKAFSALDGEGDLAMKRVDEFRRRHDMALLRVLASPDDGAAAGMVAILDAGNGRLYLGRVDGAGSVQFVSNLVRHAPDRRLDPTPENLQTFIDTRAAWLAVSPDPES